jgi:hypothetical protein
MAPSINSCARCGTVPLSEVVDGFGPMSEAEVRGVCVGSCAGPVPPTLPRALSTQVVRLHRGSCGPIVGATLSGISGGAPSPCVWVWGHGRAILIRACVNYSRVRTHPICIQPKSVRVGGVGGVLCEGSIPQKRATGRTPGFPRTGGTIDYIGPQHRMQQKKWPTISAAE